MRLRFLPLLLLAAIGLALAPVAMSHTSTTQKTTVTVTAKEFKFVLSKRSAPHGVVVFKVTNKGKLGHDFKIAGKKTPVLKPGKTASITVTLGAGSSKKYICTVPGHAAAGMKGTFRAT